jgi:hypothetical protein
MEAKRYDWVAITVSSLFVACCLNRVKRPMNGIPALAGSSALKGEDAVPD